MSEDIAATNATSELNGRIVAAKKAVKNSANSAMKYSRLQKISVYLLLQ